MSIESDKLSELVFNFDAFERSSPKETTQYLKLAKEYQFEVGGLVVDKTGYLYPISSADADAPNNTIYFSSTGSKLSYKDVAGVVHALY